MTPPNGAHPTMWTGANLDIMRSMYSESVDPICLDPPFNPNRNDRALIDSASRRRRRAL